MRMKKWLLSSVAAMLVAAGAAAAADFPVKAAPASGGFTASPWDGLYVGGNIGFGSTDFAATASLFGGSASATQNASGILGGVEAGYNRQLGMWVLGIETDFDGTSIAGTTGGVTSKLSWFGTVRARAGVLITPSFLLYGSGGVAYGHAEVTAPNLSVRIPGVGWAAGAGVEYALGGGWFLGAEYLHIDLDGPGADIGPLTVSTRATTDLGRAKLDFKF